MAAAATVAAAAAVAGGVMENFQNLVLLIGTNPLPNFVVARYFLGARPDLRVLVAVHTDETAVQVEHLETVLREEVGRPFCIKRCRLHEAGNARQVERDLDMQVVRNILRGESFHFNYTGGTKVMAVHAYKVLLAHAKRFPPGHASFSYLDADDFTLKSEDGHTWTGGQDWRELVEISFDQLLKLHGCQSNTNKNENVFRLPEINWVFRDYLRQGLILEFTAWVKEVNDEYYRRRAKLQRPGQTRASEPDFYLCDFEDKNKYPFWAYAKMLVCEHLPLPQRWQFDSETGLLLNLKADEKGKAEYQKGVAYLRGKWLECYVHEEINHALQAETNAGKFEVINNWKAIKKAALKNNYALQTEMNTGKLEVISNGKVKKKAALKSTDFELDVAIRYGYQLCGVSVTTEIDEEARKGKAFEALHRARQMGGDEARAVLIATASREEIEELTNNLEADTGGEKDLKILGLPELAGGTIWQEIKKHMKVV